MLKMYKCQDCNYQCSRKSELVRHINGMHDGDVYKCDFCSDEFKWEYRLKRHMKNKHDGKLLGGFNGFDIGNFRSFNYNGVVNMGVPSHISNISNLMDGKFDIRL